MPLTESNNAAAATAEWSERLEALVGDVKTWAEAAGFRTRRITKTVTERRLGSYEVPILLMEKDAVEVVLNPVARYVPGAAGAVDLYLAPAYDDIASLYFEGDRWVVHQATSGPNSPFGTGLKPLSEQSFRLIVDGMIAHA